MVRVGSVMKRNAATRRNAVRRTARAAASAPRRPATHFAFVCALRRLRPENFPINNACSSSEPRSPPPSANSV